MNQKQITMLAIGIIAVVAIYYIFFKNKGDKKEESGYTVVLKKDRRMLPGESCTCPSWVPNKADGICPSRCTLDF